MQNNLRNLMRDYQNLLMNGDTDNALKCSIRIKMKAEQIKQYKEDIKNGK